MTGPAPLPNMNKGENDVVLLAELALLAVQDPERFAMLAEKAGIEPPDLNVSAAGPLGVVPLSAGMDTGGGRDLGGQQLPAAPTNVLANPAVAPQAPPALPTGSTAAQILGAVQAPAAAAPLQLYPGSPGVPSTTAGADPRLLQQIMEMLSPQEERPQATFGELIRGMKA